MGQLHQGWGADKPVLILHFWQQTLYLFVGKRKEERLAWVDLNCRSTDQRKLDVNLKFKQVDYKSIQM